MKIRMAQLFTTHLLPGKHMYLPMEACMHMLPGKRMYIPMVLCIPTVSYTHLLADADAVLVRSAKMHEMELPEKLGAIARAGAGVNNIPLETCADQGIVVFNTPGANANGVKEMVFAGMLLAARDIIGGANWVQSQDGNADVAAATEKEKKKFAGSELQDVYKRQDLYCQFL